MRWWSGSTGSSFRSRQDLDGCSLGIPARCRFSDGFFKAVSRPVAAGLVPALEQHWQLPAPTGHRAAAACPGHKGLGYRPWRSCETETSTGFVTASQGPETVPGFACIPGTSVPACAFSIGEGASEGASPTFSSYRSGLAAMWVLDAASWYTAGSSVPSPSQSPATGRSPGPPIWKTRSRRSSWWFPLMSTIQRPAR